MQRIDCTAFRDDVVGTVYDVMPRAAVPVVVAREVKDAGAFYIKRDVEIAGELVEEVTGISALITAAAIIGAAHVSARSDTLVGPSLPQPIRIQSNGDDRGIYSFGLGYQIPRSQ